jgi:hypothetical protein
VAVARKLLILVYYGLRDGTIRWQTTPGAGRRGRVSRIGHSHDASSRNGMTPTAAATSRK